MKFSELKKGDLLIKPDAIFPYNEMQEVISVEKNEERNSSWSPCFILTAVGITTKHTYEFCFNDIEEEIEPIFVKVKDDKERTNIISNNCLTELTRDFINMKVYVIVTDVAYEGCSSHVDTEVFADREKAKESFDLYVKREKREAESMEYETEENENYFSAWEDGYYNTSHTTIELREVEVK